MTDRVAATDYAYLRSLLRERIGHDLGTGKEYLVESRLRPIAERIGCSGLAGLFQAARLTRDSVLVDAILEAMVTCETSFFRSTAAFDRLRATVIPALLQSRDATRRLSIWCAGCSTGQEPYSLAMLLADDFPELVRWDVSILATDLSEQALRQAREGSYSQAEVRRGLSDLALRTHFENRENRWVIRPSSRRWISFRKLNLIEPVPFHAEFDLILIRNVLIYFCQDRKLEVFGSLRRAIKDDGFLVLGESETILGQSVEFTFAAGNLDVYRPSTVLPVL